MKCELRCNRPATGVYRDRHVCDMHHADWLMADHVKHQERCCRRCGSGKDLEAAHVMRRGLWATRWDRANIVCLCRTHHAYFQTHPYKFEQWCKDVDIPWDALYHKAHNGPPMQPIFVIERLKEPA